MSNSKQPESLCRQCKNLIPQQARLCSHCNSYQDWRSWFWVSNTTLALLTALVSVISIIAPTFYKYFHTPQSKAVLTAPSLDGTTLRIIAVNRGDASASLTAARVSSEYLAPATKVRFRNDSDAIIPPGSKLITFDVIPLMNEDESYKKSIDIIGVVISKKPNPPTEIIFRLQQSNGEFSFHGFQIKDEDMFRLLRSNADRCSSIKEANFENGCIGSGAPVK